MEERIEKAIDTLASKITASVQPDHALKFTQAALNLAHVKSLLETKTSRKREANA
jgi:argininosuccinate lyase